MRASYFRPTERKMEANMSLQTFLPIYDELAKDVTESDVAEMDEALYVNKELENVYKEIVAVIPKNYLLVSSDPTIRKAATQPFEISRCIASVRLQGPSGSAQISKLPINEKLGIVNNEPPWKKEGFKNWVKTGPAKALNTSKRKMMADHNTLNSAGVAHTISEQLPDYMDPKMFLSWHSWWRQQFSTEDFYKYINRQDTDFLAHIYHLWGEGELGRYDSALGFSSGPGSPVTVSSPTRSARNVEASSRFDTPSADSGQDMWIADAAIIDKLETEDNINRQAARSAMLAKDNARIKSTTGFTKSIALKDLAAKRIEIKEEEEEAKRILSEDEILERELAKLTVQQRFERVWDLLRFDENNKLAMIFKYQGQDCSRLLHVVKLWENVTHAILKREYLLGQLEQFERIASDPNRFFDKGYLGSSQARFDEEIVRANLNKRLDAIEAEVRKETECLDNEASGDVALFRGRPYKEKMLGDRVQVLFWLSEERKANAIRNHLADKRFEEVFSNSRLMTASANERTPRTARTEKEKTQDSVIPGLSVDAFIAQILDQ